MSKDLSDSPLVASLVTDVILPPIGMLLGRVDFANLYINLSDKSYPTLVDARAAGAPVIAFGSFASLFTRYPMALPISRVFTSIVLTLVGIHTPEFPPYAGEHDKGNLARALTKYGIGYPNAQDNDSRAWDAYGIRYWPSFVLIDKRGVIRYTGYGEFHLDDVHFRTWDARIRELLAE